MAQGYPEISFSRLKVLTWPSNCRNLWQNLVWLEGHIRHLEVKFCQHLFSIHGWQSPGMSVRTDLAVYSAGSVH